MTMLTKRLERGYFILADEREMLLLASVRLNRDVLEEAASGRSQPAPTVRPSWRVM